MHLLLPTESPCGCSKFLSGHAPITVEAPSATFPACWLEDDPDMLYKSWMQCGWHEAWNTDFQITMMYADGTLYPCHDPSADLLEPEPSSGSNPVDADGNPVTAAARC